MTTIWTSPDYVHPFYGYFMPQEDESDYNQESEPDAFTVAAQVRARLAHEKLLSEEEIWDGRNN